MRRLERQIETVNDNLAKLYDEFGRVVCEEAQDHARHAARCMMAAEHAEADWRSGGFGYLAGIFPHNKATNTVVTHIYWAQTMAYSNYTVTWPGPHD